MIGFQEVGKALVNQSFDQLAIQLSKLIKQKDQVEFGGFPGLAIGLISAIRQVAGTSPESQE